VSERVAVALIGAGMMGAYHAESLARRLPAARLAAVADPSEEAGRGLVARLDAGSVRYERDYQAVLADPEIRAVVIASPGASHPEVTAAAAQAGKHVFCEKPLGYSLEEADRALTAVATSGVLLQMGFQRRFDSGFLRTHALVADGTLGSVQLLRSITRDPELQRPESPLPWAIFRETLIHDFDVLRWLADSEAVEVFAMADTLIAPEYRERGLLDTAVVCVRFANGALATADASFRAVYGYDVRAEVFGSAGMATVGEGRLDSAWHYGPAGVSRPHAHWFLDLFGAAYTAELAHFVDCVATGRPAVVTGQDGRASLAMALAAVESVQTGRPARVANTPSP
jgi:myo-inositol 2-dehydrogenase / D-chiro-inositol 1-dehydrogenase